MPNGQTDTFLRESACDLFFSPRAIAQVARYRKKTDRYFLKAVLTYAVQHIDAVFKKLKKLQQQQKESLREYRERNKTLDNDELNGSAQTSKALQRLYGTKMEKALSDLLEGLEITNLPVWREYFLSHLDQYDVRLLTYRKDS